MKKRSLPAKSKKEQVKRQRDPLPWRYCLLTLVCGLILVGGFFYAARQHFSAMDLGMKNAKLRQQKDEFHSEQRRLNLAREISLSPAEIKKAAKKIGFQEFAPTAIEVVSRKIESVNPLAEKKSDDKPKQAFVQNAAVKEVKAKSEKETKEDKPKAQSSSTSGGGDIRPRIAKK
jgi:hypothetical protein